MKTRDILYSAVFLLGIVIYCFLTRYDIVTGDNITAYRIDRITGEMRYYVRYNWYEPGERLIPR
ncbi:MAG TPA: hypothetical protein ENH82_06780 [bacterium]|nr:hypothetical protein [bacterium]